MRSRNQLLRGYYYIFYRLRSIGDYSDEHRSEVASLSMSGLGIINSVCFVLIAEMLTGYQLVDLGTHSSLRGLGVAACFLLLHYVMFDYHHRGDRIAREIELEDASSWFDMGFFGYVLLAPVSMALYLVAQAW